MRDAAQAECELIAAGIPAHAVLHSPGLYADPQLQHLHHFVPIEHPHHGSVTVEGSRLSLSATPASERGAPSFGLHTVEILTEMLGYDFDRLGELFAAGALD